ncbi:MAG: DUF4271 domain-containing protein [Bacteroidales bacterium]|nr:DUF4271 domain-containing protein [Bacteroidales bacterium]
MSPAEIIGQLGQLEMSSRPYSLPPAAFCWSEVPSNRILTCLAVLIFLFNIRNLFSLFSPMIYSLRSARGQVDLEYNVSVSRLRNHIALVFFLPFCLLADRFELFPADFKAELNPNLHCLVSAGAIALYLLFRSLCQALLRAFSPGRDESTALKRSLYSYIISICPIMLLSGALLPAFGVGDAAVRIVLLCILGATLIVSYVRSFQILHAKSSSLLSFLYLCGLEFIPAAVLITAALVF